MLLVQIEGFLEVAKRGSVSRAAEILYVTQPTLTARLHGLEKELDERLFVRTRHGMRLTDSGRAFLPFAERAVRAVREGRDALEQVRSASAGHLVIASAPAVSTYLLPEILARFVTAHPRVEVAVRTGHSEDVLRMVLRDEVQLGLGRALTHPEVELQPFHEEQLVLVVAPAHAFARKGRVRMADVGGEQLIMFDRTSSYYEITQAAFLSAGVTLKQLMELDNIEATKKMVERGLGVALLPRASVVREVAAGQLRLVTIADAPPMRRSIVAMRRRDAGPPSGVVAAFLTLLDVGGAQAAGK
jgi:DNA-binding transcriptional LysR family regulator